MAQNDIFYTKTGEGTSAAAVGHENGPFQNWETQPSATTGYASQFDQSINEVFTDLKPQVVFGGWREHMAVGNTVSFNRGDLYEEDEFDDSYILTQPVELSGRKGIKKTIYLDHVIKLGKIFQNFELETAGADYLNFEYEQAIKGLARKFETKTVKDLVDNGLDSDSLIAKTSEGVKDIYNTFLNVRKAMIERGNELGNIDVYATPDIVNAIMNDSHFISTFGNAPVAGEEVRSGFRGMYLGFYIYESGRLSGMSTVLGKPVDLMFIDRTQVILCRKVVKTLSLVPAPSTYIGCSLLTALEYFKHYIVNDYSVRYLAFNAAI